MVQVAIDAGPLYGPRTGIGNAVDWTLEALSAVDGLELSPYVVSARARVVPPQVRLPLPAAVAHRLWARCDVPKMDRWLGHPDVVHGTNYVVPPTGAPRTVSVYDCWFLEHPSDAHPDVARAAQVLRRSVAAGAHVVTSSEATTTQVRELLDTDRVITVPLGPPPAGVSPSVRPAATGAIGEHFVVAIGTIERRKNIPLLVDAFARLASEHETVELVIAGRRGNDAEAVDTAISGLDTPVRERVHRLGAVDAPTKQWLLHHARALAYPSLDEGFGFPILEAQQAGTPVVASSAGSIPEVSGPGALLSLPTDPLALAANLFGVVGDTTRRDRVITAGYENVARFSWATTADLLAEHYRTLANGRSSPTAQPAPQPAPEKPSENEDTP